jgi:hypothetical protein
MASSLTLYAKAWAFWRVPVLVGAAVATKNTLVRFGAEFVGETSPIERAAHDAIIGIGTGRDGL